MPIYHFLMNLRDYLLAIEKIKNVCYRGMIHCLRENI